ncbi:MAG: hypothetical protein ACTSWE_02375 [Promethearchaeota archaeon]
MNKKKFLMFGILAILAMGLVIAVNYYEMLTISFTINQPIKITGNLNPDINCNAGEICIGDMIRIENKGTKDRELIINTNNSNEDISINYIVAFDITNNSDVQNQIFTNFNKDKIVSFGDLNILVYWWFKNVSCNDTNKWCNGSDLDKNNIIDDFDNDLFITYWNWNKTWDDKIDIVSYYKIFNEYKIAKGNLIEIYPVFIVDKYASASSEKIYITIA